MKFFGSKPTAVTLVRAWCSPFGDDGPAGEFLALVDQILALMPPATLEGALNDGYGSPLSALRRALAKLAPEGVQSLSLQDEAGETVFQGRGCRSTRGPTRRRCSAFSSCCRRRPRPRRIACWRRCRPCASITATRGCWAPTSAR